MNDLISKLSEIRSEYNCFNQDEEPYYHALSEVISILSRQKDGDTISRKSAIDTLKKAYWDNDIQSAKDDLCIVDAMTDWSIRQIKALPSVERRGRWIRTGEDGYCSICKCDMPMYKEDWEWEYIETPYCPNCGAKMDEVE